MMFNALESCDLNLDVLGVIGRMTWLSWLGLSRTCKVLHRELAPFKARAMKLALTRRFYNKKYGMTVEYRWPKGKKYKVIYAGHGIDGNEGSHLSTVVRYLYAQNGVIILECMQYQSDLDYLHLYDKHYGTYLINVGWYIDNECLCSWKSKENKYCLGYRFPTTKQKVAECLAEYGVEPFIMKYLAND